MRSDLTDMTVILDRSGSMASCREEAERGLNGFITEQRQQPGHATFTLVQFDNEYEFVHRGIPIQDVPHCPLEPRGNTALLDAIGRAIHETGTRLKEIPEADRPGLVVFVIITDGAENSSCEFTKAQVREMIEHQQSKYSWQFTFLGANQDAFAEASALGIDADAAVDFSAEYADRAFNAAADNVRYMREATETGASVLNRYTPAVRSSLKR